MKKGTFLLVACLVVALSLGSFAEAGYKIVNLPKNLGNPYFDACNQGAQEAAETQRDKGIPRYLRYRAGAGEEGYLGGGL